MPPPHPQGLLEPLGVLLLSCPARAICAGGGRQGQPGKNNYINIYIINDRLKAQPVKPVHIQ